MDKSNRLLPRLKPLLINQRNNRPPKRTRSRGAPNTKQIATARDNEAVPVSRDVRVRAPDSIEAANTRLRGAIIRASPFVPDEREIGASDVVRDDVGLPLGGVVDVGEAAAGVEPVGRDLGVLPRRAVRRQIRRPDGQDVRARREELRVEHVVPRAHAPRGVRVGREPGHPVVARGDHDRRPLQAELHDLGALPLLVGRRELRLRAAVRDADHVRRRVQAAVQLPLVPAFVGVWVFWVAALRALAVACLAVGFEGAVAAVDGVPEV